LKEPRNYDPELLTAFQTLQIGPVPPSVAFYLGANVDALFEGEGGSLPSTVILNYVYGVAAYKFWHSNRGDVDVMDEYRQNYHADIPPFPRGPPTARDESGLSKAMDELNVFLMHIHGITPEEAAERRQKEIEQEERAAQEASRSKVIEWMEHMDA
jgi:hypothetical protein